MNRGGPQDRNTPSAIRYFLVALIVILLDQFVKLAVKFKMHPGEELPLVGQGVKLTYIENPGAAFGLTLSDLATWIGCPLPEEMAKKILTLLSLFAVIGIAWLIHWAIRRGSHWGLPLTLALIMGGALGNILDRVFYGVWFAGLNHYEGGLLQGRVVDMIYLDIWHGKIFGREIHFLPVINLADIAIFLGFLVMLVFNRPIFRTLEAKKVPMEASRGETGGEEEEPPGGDEG